MSTRFEDGKMDSSFVCEEYLAAKVVLADTPEDCRHIAFEYSDTDLLEFGLDRESGLLKKVVLVLSNHFSVCDTALDAPAAPDRIPYFDLPRECPCDAFETLVHTDGIHIRLSAAEAASYAACGILVIGTDDDGELVEVFVKGLSPDEVAHVIHELELGSVPD